MVFPKSLVSSNFMQELSSDRKSLQVTGLIWDEVLEWKDGLYRSGD
jgi:hypothetical protein